MYLAKEAEALGLVDDIGYLNDATQYAKTAASLSDPQVVRYEEPKNLLQTLLLGSSNARPPQATGAINLSIDPAALERLGSLRMMYLWWP